MKRVAIHRSDGVITMIRRINDIKDYNNISEKI